MNLKKLSEKELLVQAQTNEEAFTELYQRYHQLVYFVAFKLCKNDADAQDVVQDTFIEIKRSLKDLKNLQYFRLWLYRIIDSKCKKLFRKNKYTLIDIEQDQIQNAILVKDHQAVPMERMQFQNDQELLHHMIQELPYDQKLAIILFYMEQMTTLEISQCLQVPEGTVKSRLSVARATLKKKVEAYEHREGVKLNFHDLSTALTTAFAGITVGTQVPSMKSNALSNKAQHFINAIKASTISMKIAIGACAVALASATGYEGYQSLHPSNDTIIHEAVKSSNKQFPTLQFRGQEITSSKDAYYTLKMHVCKQDIEFLSKTERAEVDVLYQALKEENGVFYQNLKDTDWEMFYKK